MAALFNKGIMLGQRGNLDEAIKIMERVALKHPEFEKGKSKLREFQVAAKAKA